MNYKKIYKILTFMIASVWLINGLFCKVLNLTPRHHEIVERILGDNHSRMITIIIGVSEILIALWIISQYKSKLNALAQITIVAVMNVIEFFIVQDLLLWGAFNSLFALLFMILVYYTNFKLHKKHVIIS